MAKRFLFRGLLRFSKAWQRIEMVNLGLEKRGMIASTDGRKEGRKFFWIEMIVPAAGFHIVEYEMWRRLLASDRVSWLVDERRVLK